MLIRRFVLPALVGLAAYYAVFGGEYSVLEVRQIRAEAAEAHATLAELGEETERLRTRVEDLENDPRVLEDLAREDFGMIREGEVLYRFADSVHEDAPEEPVR